MRHFYRVCVSLLTIALLSACQDDRSADTLAQKQLTDPSMAPNPWNNNGCELVTDDEVEKIFNVRRREDVLNTQTLPDKCFCLRVWNKTDWKEREANNEKPGVPYMEPRNTLVVQVLDYGTEEIAEAQFAMLERDRRDTYDEKVEEVGDEALWSTTTTTLVVRRRQLVLNITLEYVDDPKGNLPKAKEVAAVALRKM